jgi:CelD/BcsL family acetyltransferase involved in cellulose biosynthesis
MAFRSQILSSAADVSQVSADWEALAATTLHPMQGPVWHGCASRFVHASSDQLHVIALWDEGQLAGLAPLMLTNGPTGRRYEIIGTRVLYEPAAMLARTEEAADQLARAVASLKHPVALTRMAAAHPFNDRFVRYARRAGWVALPTASGSPHVELGPGWEAYYENLPSRLKNVIRRGHRQLGKSGRVEFEFLKPEAARVTGLLQQAFEVELRSWKRRSGSAVLLRPELREFFFHYAEKLAERGELLVSFMRLDGVPVAMQVANISFDAYWQLKIGYDERYAKQLVGLQLQMETIKWSSQQGLRSYEFLGTAEPWLQEWTSTVHGYRTMYFYPFNVSGLGALLRDNIARVRGRLARRTRTSPDSTAGD